MFFCANDHKYDMYSARPAGLELSSLFGKNKSEFGERDSITRQGHRSVINAWGNVR